MATLQWDRAGERLYETGVDHGVLYLQNNGVYDEGHAWNGLTTVTESPSGAESNPQYADNIKYVNLQSVEEFGGTIEAFMSPVAFDQCDGMATPQAGLRVGQQSRKTFGLSYRTKVGNDQNPDAGYKIHLVWGALAAPSEKAFATVNDSPEPIGLSWEFTTTPVEVGTVDGETYKPVASMTADSTLLPASAMQDLEDALYGTSGTEPRLPLPREVIQMFSGTVTEVAPLAPSYDAASHTITIPTVTGVTYMIDGEPVTGAVTITEDTVVDAAPTGGYKFPKVSDDDWYFKF